MKFSDLGLIGVNGMVPCAPFEKADVKRANSTGLNLTPGGQGTELVALTVLARAEVAVGDVVMRIRPGDRIYIRAEEVVKPWAKPIRLARQDDGKVFPEFIMVPFRDVYMLQPGGASPEPIGGALRIPCSTS